MPNPYADLIPAKPVVSSKGNPYADLVPKDSAATTKISSLPAPSLYSRLRESVPATALLGPTPNEALRENVTKPKLDANGKQIGAKSLGYKPFGDEFEKQGLLFAHPTDLIPKVTGPQVASILPTGTPQPVSDVLAGAERGVAGGAESLISPVVAGTALFGGGLPPLVSRALSATFAPAMVKGAIEHVKGVYAAAKKQDWGAVAEHLTGTGLDAYFGYKSAVHALQPGVVNESPALRNILTEKIQQQYSPEQMRAIYQKVNQGTGTPVENELVRYINTELEHPGEAVREGATITEQKPRNVKPEAFAKWLGMDQIPNVKGVTIGGQAQPETPQAVPSEPPAQLSPEPSASPTPPDSSPAELPKVAAPVETSELKIAPSTAEKSIAQRLNLKPEGSWLFPGKGHLWTFTLNDPGNETTVHFERGTPFEEIEKQVQSKRQQYAEAHTPEALAETQKALDNFGKPPEVTTPVLPTSGGRSKLFEQAAQEEAKSQPVVDFPKLVSAAVKTPDGKVLQGPNHPAIDKELGKPETTREQRNTPDYGFVDSTGKFVTREQATEIAKASGQALQDFEEGHPLHSDQVQSATEPGKTIAETSQPIATAPTELADKLQKDAKFRTAHGVHIDLQPGAEGRVDQIMRDGLTQGMLSDIRPDGKLGWAEMQMSGPRHTKAGDVAYVMPEKGVRVKSGTKPVAVVRFTRDGQTLFEALRESGSQKPDKTIKETGQAIREKLPANQHELPKDQALAIVGGRPKLLPKPGETKPQLQDTTGQYFIGQTADGRYFTEHRRKPVATPSPVKEGEKAKTRTFRQKYSPDKFGEDPLIALIKDSGGLMSKTTAKTRGKLEKNASLWDDAPGLSHPSHNKVYRSEGGLMPDEMAQIAYNAHLIPEADASALWAGIDKASKGARKTVQSEKQFEAQAKTADKQVEDFNREVLTAGNGKATDASDLNVGDVVNVQTPEGKTEKIKVVAVDADTHEVTLDGKKYGVQIVNDDDILYTESVDKPLTLESPTEDQLNEEKATAARKTELEKGLSKPLTGTAGDMSGDMFDRTKADNPLFAPPKPKPITETPPPKPAAHKSAAEALHQGQPVKLPAGANAVQVRSTGGGYAKALKKDLDTLQGGGPYSSVKALKVQTSSSGVVKWGDAEEVKGKVEVVTEKAKSKLSSERGSIINPAEVIQKGAEKVGEAIAPVRAALDEAFDTALKIFAPTTRSGQAGSTGQVIAEKAAQAALDFIRVEHSLADARKLFAKRSNAENIESMQAADTGESTGDPEHDALLKKITSIYEPLKRRVDEIKGGPQQWREYYFPHIWKPRSGKDMTIIQMLSKRPWEGSKAFTKQRVYNDIQEGIEAGLEPVSYNPVDMALLKYKEMQRFITAHDAFDELKSNGLMKYVPAGQRGPDGWTKIDDRLGTVFGPRRGAVKLPPGSNIVGEGFGEGSLVPEDVQVAGLRIMGNYYAPEPVARVINNYLSPGLRSKSGLFRGYIASSNMLNQFQLGLSAFHLGFTSLDAMTSKFALALESAMNGRLVNAAKYMVQTPFAPVSTLLKGRELQLAALADNEWLSPELAAMVDAVVQGGGRFKQEQFYQTQTTQKMLDAFRQGNILSGLFKVPFSVIEQAARPIMEYVVPWQKLGVFADLAKYDLEQLGEDATPEQVRATLQKSWDSVDNRMGQLVYDNLFWNKAAKDLGMASVRSLGWNLGTFREIGGGGFDAGKAAWQTLHGKRPTVTHRIGYTLALPILVGLLGAIYMYLRTGKKPETLKDYYFPKNGGKDAEGRDTRDALPSYMKDLAAYRYQPGQTLANKLHPGLSIIAQMLENQDFYGVKIRNEGDPLVRQAMELAQYAGTQLEPFGVRGAEKLASEGRPLASQALPFVGITPAPGYIVKGQAEQLAAKIMADHIPRGARTKEQADKSMFNASLRNAEKAGDTNAVQNALDTGKIDSSTATRIDKESGETYLERMLTHLTPVEALKVFHAATPQEKAQIKDLVERKIDNSHTLTDDQKDAAYKELDELGK